METNKKKEELKNALLGMRLSKKESEAIKGGVAVAVAPVGTASVSVAPISTVTVSGISVAPTIDACFCLPTCTVCITNGCKNCTHTLCATTGNSGW